MNFHIFSLYFIVIICKNFCFALTNYCGQYYEQQTSLMINFDKVSYMHILSVKKV